MNSLSGDAYKVWQELASQIDDFSLSVEQIAERTGVHKRNISNAYAELKLQGFIKYDKYRSIEVLYPTEAKPKVKQAEVKKFISENSNRKDKKNRKKDSLSQGFNKKELFTHFNNEYLTPFRNELLTQHNRYK